MDCHSPRSGEDLGPLGIDYSYLYNCVFSDIHVLFYLMVMLWIILLMSLLAHTASNYFSPTLGAICDKLNLAYDIAGVTFLALGNGAPDFFSLVASFSGGADVLVGVGALLGGGVFISTVVVGLVATFCPCEISKDVFLRDISFHIFAVLCVTTIAIVKKIYIGVAICFIIFYCVYVSVVTSASILKTLRKKKRPKYSESGDIPLTSFNNNMIQTAFWHKPTDYHAPIHRPSTEEAKFPVYNPFHPLSANSATEYKFVIVDPDEADDADKGGQNGDAGDDHEEGNQATINFSGGFTPNFDEIIHEEYYAVDAKAEEENNDFSAARQYEMEVDEAGFLSGKEPSVGGALTEQLLDRDGSMIMEGVLEGSLGAGSLKRRDQRMYRSVVGSLFWRQWMLQRRVRRGLVNIVADWRDLPLGHKVLLVIWLPVTLARDLTIPTLDDQNWNKLFAVLHPFAMSLFISFLCGGFSPHAHPVGPIPVPVIWLLSAIPPSACVYVLTHQNKAPRGRVITILWSLTAFVMCIFWIYMLAGELVACLSTLGVLLDLPPAFLGLTVLAWGNSVGDLFTNTAVARQGLGEMAIAGCYGGPVFNILVGLGMGLLFGTAKAYPSSYYFRLDTSSILSLVFLLISLSSTVAIVSYRGFRIDKLFGIYLLTLYVVYTLCQATLVAF